MDKSLSLGMLMLPQGYIQEVQAYKLGDAQGIPFFINKNIRFLFQCTIFLLLHILCVILGASLFLCVVSLVFFLFFFSLINSWILAFLCGRETHSIFQISWLVLETSTMFIVMQMKACFDCGIDFYLS